MTLEMYADTTTPTLVIDAWHACVGRCKGVKNNYAEFGGTKSSKFVWTEKKEVLQ